MCEESREGSLGGVMGIVGVGSWRFGMGNWYRAHGQICMADSSAEMLIIDCIGCALGIRTQTLTVIKSFVF